MARSGDNARIPAIGQYSQTSAATFGADLTELANDVAQKIGESVANFGALPASGSWPGRTIFVRENKKLYIWDGTSWYLRDRINGAQFVGSTSGTGIVTINHGLGAVPAWVQITGFNSGAVPTTRNIIVSATSDTQIQVYVTNGGNALPSNPVVFYWTAGI